MSGHHATREEINTAFAVFYDRYALLMPFDELVVLVPCAAIGAIFREFPDEPMRANKEINILIGAIESGRTVEEQRVVLEAWFEAEFAKLKNR